MTSLTVGLVQMDVADGRATENLSRAVTSIRSAPRARLYLLPELCSTGYAYSGWRGSAEMETPAACEVLQHLSVERDAFIAAGLISLDDGRRLTNRLWVFSPDGAAPVTYDKGHLFSPLQEDRYLQPGTQRVRLAIDGWTVALSICFDLRFPEMYRHDALAGADFFLVVAQWPNARAAVLRTLATARAIENQAFLALCNRSGSAADGLGFAGGSVLIAPDGSIVADAGRTAGVVIARAERDVVTAAHELAPLLELRRPGLDW